MPQELLQLNYIDRFGAQAVMGRNLGYKEMQHMVLAENVVKAYEDRNKSKSWASWAKEHPEKAQLLAEALMYGE